MRILGGYQSDFARHWGREGRGIADLTREAVGETLSAARLLPAAIDSIHVGNAFGELFTGQAHLASMPATVCPSLWGIPAMRHEAACASGSLAVLCALRDIAAGHAECVLVLGVELERHVDVLSAAAHLGSAGFVGQEGAGHVHLWPHLFSRIADVYAQRYGLDDKHLAALAQKNFAQAKHNPNAQTRSWKLTPAHFGADPALNPEVDGRLRRHDCSQITDGAAGLILASQHFAESHARQNAIKLAPQIAGWGHHNGPLPLQPKLARLGADAPYVLPEVRSAITSAFSRAGLQNAYELDGVETHDCFTISEYLAIDHFGVTPPGRAWEAIEAGTVAMGGALPFNPSGGLIGGGHPVGATGVRMVLDAAKQVSGLAGAYQVPDAKRFATLNLGGSGATAVCFVLENA